MPAYPDEQLVLEALDDSHQAFEQLVEQYQYRVMRTIASIVSDEQAVQDVAQETFLAAWRNLPKLEARHKFGGWLNQIAVNLSKRWLRDERRYQEDTDSLEESAVVLTQELRYQREKLRQEVWDAIDELADDHREAVTLYYISGYSYREIGEMLSVPVSTVHGRLQQAKKQLRKEFLDMVTRLQLEIDSTVHKFLEEQAKQDGVSVEGLIIRLIERYRRDTDADASAPEMITRRIWENVQDAGAVSPDGRYDAYVNWDKGNLAIHDFETGEDRDVTDEGNWGKNSEWAVASEWTAWSPDGKQIAYAWDKGPRDHRETSLRIVGIDGSKPRVLYSSTAGPKRLLPRVWSRDGKYILGIHCKETDETHDIVLAAVADGSIRVLKSVGHKVRPKSISPDGRYVAYDSPQSDDSQNHDIFLLATDGSRETALVEHPADDFAPFWTPEGDRIVFASDRSGNMGLWILEVVDGKPKGSPRLISDNLNGMFPLGMTQDGSYYYGLISSDVDVYMAAIDPETGEVVTPPTKAIQSLEGFNYSPAFSPDGKRLVYMSVRPRGSNTNFRAIVIRSLETGEERILSPELTNLGRLPQWSLDGRSIIAVANGADKRRGLYQIDTETDVATPVILDDGQAFDEHGHIVAVISPVWSPDGNRIFFVRKRNMVIRAYDLETEREWSPDFRSEHGKDCRKHVLALSPDGQWLAFIECFDGLHSYQIAPCDGGETREILRLPGEEMPFFHGETWLEWTPDGRHLLFGRLKDEATELWRISVEGGEPQNLGLKMRKMAHLNVHPDGRSVTFTGPGSGRSTEVWAMENFLPGFTASN